MRPAVKMIPFIACDDRSDFPFTDTRIPNRYALVWLCTRANWRAIFHALCTFYQIGWSRCNRKFACFTKISALIIFLRK
jgi:hypothetical protein